MEEEKATAIAAVMANEWARLLCQPEAESLCSAMVIPADAVGRGPGGTVWLTAHQEVTWNGPQERETVPYGAVCCGQSRLCC